METGLISQVLLVETEGHYFYLILIPDDPEETEFPLKLILALDDHYFKKLYPLYGEETDLDIIYYGKNPVIGLKTDSPVNCLQFMDIKTKTSVPEFGVRYIVNGKYKDPGDQNFIDVIEDLESISADEAKSELIKEIHKKFKD